MTRSPASLYVVVNGVHKRIDDLNRLHDDHKQLKGTAARGRRVAPSYV